MFSFVDVTYNNIICYPTNYHNRCILVIFGSGLFPQGHFRPRIILPDHFLSRLFPPESFPNHFLPNLFPLINSPRSFPHNHFSPIIDSPSSARGWGQRYGEIIRESDWEWGRNDRGKCLYEIANIQK